jgi:hypothetical protein
MGLTWTIRNVDGGVELSNDGDDFYSVRFDNKQALKEFVERLVAAGNTLWPKFVESKGRWRDLLIGEDVLPGDRYLQDGAYEIISDDDWVLPCHQEDYHKGCLVTQYERWVPNE